MSPIEEPSGAGALTAASNQGDGERSSAMNLPKITIVTPSYNQGHFLDETIQSVLDQKYPNLEYFVVDGGSKDNSVEVIKKYEQHITWWVSEKDRGQPH